MWKKACIALVLGLAVCAIEAQELQFGPGPSAPGEALDTIVAVVDDDIITRSELLTQLAAIRRQLEAQGAEIPPENVLERQVLERMIQQRIQVRAAERNNIVVDDQSINAAIEEIAQRNNMSLEELRQAVERRENIPFAEFREGIREEIAVARLRQRVVDSRIRVSEQEVDNLLVRSNRPGGGAREYRLAQILIAVPEGANPAELAVARQRTEEVLAELRGGADFQNVAVSVSAGRQALEGGDLGWRSAEQIPTIFADVIPNLSVGEVSEPIRSPSGFHLVTVLDTRGDQQPAITQTRARHILLMPNDLVSDEEARQRLLRLRERILGGEDFAALARANSEDPGSAAQGGDLGWVSPGQLVPPFEEAMARLSPGEVSEPVQTNFGWHLIQVLERRLQEAAGEAQRAGAREALFRRKADEEWEIWLRQLRDQAYVEIRL